MSDAALAYEQPQTGGVPPSQDELASGIMGITAETAGGEGSGLPPRDVLLNNMPALGNTEVGDTELSSFGDLYKAYRQKLEQAADRVIAGGASIDMWHKVAKSIRQDFTNMYMDQRRAEQEAREKQKRVDTELQDRFITRLAPDSANPPTTQEILTSPMSGAAKENVWRFMHAMTSVEPGPTAKESANNQAELHRRIGLPDDDPAKIRSEEEIHKAYNTDRKINYTAMQQLQIHFRELYGATDSENRKAQEDIVKSVQSKIRPMLALGHMQEDVADPEGATRELSYRRYVQEQVKQARAAGKNPLMTILNPDSSEFIGKDVKRWQPAGGSMQERINAGKDKQTNFAVPKTIPELQQQYNAGRFGPPGSDQARRDAYTEGLRLNLYSPAPTVAPPVR